jgi:hypothetical protein
LTPATKIKLTFGFGVAILAGSGIAALSQTFAWEESVRKVTRSHEAIEKLDELALRVQEPDGFRFAQESESDLDRLTADTPSQRENLYALRQLVREPAAVSGAAWRAAILRMETEQRRLLIEQSASSEQHRVMSHGAFALGAILSLTLIVGAGGENPDRPRAARDGGTGAGGSGSAVPAGRRTGRRHHLPHRYPWPVHLLQSGGAVDASLHRG